MTAYKMPIILAIIIFPMVAFLFTLPYLIYQYRKYGAIPIMRSIIFYSFILYLISAYFLVIMPLPSLDSVRKLTTPTMQLYPFDFIREILATTHIQMNSLSSIANFFKNPNVYVALFNLCLTLPFGFYLKYYFGCKWYKVILYTFLLSLFFEVTQLTGLYGIYPRPYRLFDVDDLILNTSGGLLGCFLTPLALLILPSRQELDEKSYIKGKQVTIFRRFLAFCIDFFFLAILIAIIKIMFYNTNISGYTLFISLIIYYVIIPLITNGQTFGKMMVKLKISATDKKDISKKQIFARFLLGYILFYYQSALIHLLQPLTKNSSPVIAVIIQIIIVSLVIFKWLNIGSILVALFKKEKLFLYEKITNTKNNSTIAYNLQKEDKEMIENQISTEKGEDNVRNQENKQKL